MTSAPQTAATIHDGSPYAEGLANAFAESFQALGGTITQQVSIQTGESDYSSILTDLATDEPELLYFPIFVAEGGLDRPAGPGERKLRVPGRVRTACSPMTGSRRPALRTRTAPTSPVPTCPSSLGTPTSTRASS